MSLADKDRIFTNVYGYQGWGLKASGPRGRGGAGFPAGALSNLTQMVEQNHDYRGEW